MVLLIIAGACLWAFLPALVTSFITWEVMESRSLAVRSAVVSGKWLRFAEVFLAWFVLFVLVFSLLIWRSFSGLSSM